MPPNGPEPTNRKHTDDSPLTPDLFAEITDVSRETLDRLQIYVDHLTKWQSALNLVSRRSLEDVWRRHMLDSAQLAPLLPDAGSIADLGSGAGFPGLVLAIMTDRTVELIESDVRKGVFLREAARLTDAPATVTTGRIDVRAAALPKKPVDILTARALAPLATLCEMADSLGAETCVFLKGEQWRDELTAAEKDWKMDVDVIDSLSAQASRVLRIRNLRPHGAG